MWVQNLKNHTFQMAALLAGLLVGGEFHLIIVGPMVYLISIVGTLQDSPCKFKYSVQFLDTKQLRFKVLKYTIVLTVSS